MPLENSEKDCIYISFSGKIEDLAEEITGFCNSRYGDQCEFRTVSIHRTQEGKTWKLHSFQNLQEALQPIKRHLKARTDSVRVHFGGSEESLEIRVAKGRSSEELARFLKKEDINSLDEDEIVVLAIDRDKNSMEAAEEFLSSLE